MFITRKIMLGGEGVSFNTKFKIKTCEYKG